MRRPAPPPPFPPTAPNAVHYGADHNAPSHVLWTTVMWSHDESHSPRVRFKQLTPAGRPLVWTSVLRPSHNQTEPDVIVSSDDVTLHVTVLPCLVSYRGRSNLVMKRNNIYQTLIMVLMSMIGNRPQIAVNRQRHI